MTRAEQMAAAVFLRHHLPRLGAIPSRLQRIREGLRLWKSVGLDPAAFWHWLRVARAEYQHAQYWGSRCREVAPNVWEIRW